MRALKHRAKHRLRHPHAERRFTWRRAWRSPAMLRRVRVVKVPGPFLITGELREQLLNGTWSDA